MPIQAKTTKATPLFAAELTPHRSLSKQGARWVVALAAGLALVPGVLFFTLGAWPVVGFMGLDVLAITLALHVSLKRGRVREQITVWPDQLEIAAIDGKGARTLRRFQPRAVKLVLQRDDNERTTGLHLRAGKDALEIGAFLHPDDKSSFGKALGTALRQARAASKA